MSNSLLGRPLWYELLTSDRKAAEKFYTAVLGVPSAPFDGSPAGDYTMLMRDGQVPVAGMMNIPEGMGFPPHWEMYFGVPNLEHGVKKVEQLGGSALSDVITVPNIGRMRTMQDPHGAVFSLYEPSSPPNPEAEPAVGEVSWHELYTDDVDAAMKFYRDLFGWRETEAMDMGPMGKYQMFGRSTTSMGGIMKKPAEMGQVPNHWLPYFRVPDVNVAGDRVKANGGQVLNTMEVPGGDWIAQCMDPQGAAFAVHHSKK